MQFRYTKVGAALRQLKYLNLPSQITGNLIENMRIREDKTCPI